MRRAANIRKAKGRASMRQCSREFTVAEYNTLRKEIEIHIADRSRVESQVYIGVFAIYGWLSVNVEKLEGIYERIGLGLPIAIVVLGFIRWWGIHSRTILIGTYIKDRIEILYPADGAVGWETYLSGERKREPILRNSEGASEFAGWFVLFLLTLAIYTLRFGLLSFS